MWATWDRLPLLTGEVERAIHRAIGDKYADLGAELIALGGIEDHLHLLVQLPATISIADFVNHLKGSSSHLVTHYIKHQREHHTAGTLIAAYEPDALADTPKTR